MRTLAIDLGTRRVGLAMSDEGGRFATPLEVLQIGARQDAAAKVIATVQREGVQRLIVGVPLNMDDSMGFAARAAVAWGTQTAQQAGIPVVFVDERLSSFDADHSLAVRRRAGERLTHKRKKERQDALAAAGFLQAFLDGKLPALDLPEPR